MSKHSHNCRPCFPSLQTERARSRKFGGLNEAKELQGPLPVYRCLGNVFVIMRRVHAAYTTSRPVFTNFEGPEGVMALKKL